MTRKDYVAIAAAIKAAYTRAQIANAIADAMARDNPHFDRARFLKACGMEG